MEPKYIQINKNEALGALESLGSARRLQESEKGASVLRVFRSFSSSRALLEPFGVTKHNQNESKNHSSNRAKGLPWALLGSTFEVFDGPGGGLDLGLIFDRP